MAAITVAAFAESMNINRSDSVEHNVDRNNELKVRNRRFLFNLFPGAFNDENYQVQTLQQQQRVLSRYVLSNENCAKSASGLRGDRATEFLEVNYAIERRNIKHKKIPHIQVYYILITSVGFNRVQPVNSLFSHQSLNFYLQALLQQRMVRQRYFDLTGERVSYYNDVNYNN